MHAVAVAKRILGATKAARVEVSAELLRDLIAAAEGIWTGGYAAGQTVWLDSAHGVIERVVVATRHSGRGLILDVARREEFVAAAREGRAPQSVGFPASDVVPTPDSAGVAG